MKAATPPDSPETGPDVPATPSVSHAVRGRNGYDNFGAIRTKPGRADSTPTISLSCSDKIANWTVLGLQGALLEDLFDPVYLKGIVVGGLEHEPPSGWKNRPGKTWREVIRREIERALWGRLGSLIGESCLPPSDHTDLQADFHRPLTCIRPRSSSPMSNSTTPRQESQRRRHWNHRRRHCPSRSSRCCTDQALRMSCTTAPDKRVPGSHPALSS